MLKRPIIFELMLLAATNENTILLHIFNKGESNGKLPPRTCPGCSVPEPYRSHDGALVPARPGLQG